MATAFWADEDYENQPPHPNLVDSEEKKDEKDKKKSRRGRSASELKDTQPAEDLLLRIRQLEEEKKNMQKDHDKELATMRSKLADQEKEFTTELITFKKQYDDLKLENTELVNDITSKSLELESTSKRLSESEHDYKELLDQVTDQQDKAPPTPKPRGVAIVDPITAPLECLLSTEVKWEVLLKSPDEAENFFEGALQVSPDIVLFMTGATAMKNGLAGLACYNHINNSVNNLLKAKCKVAILQLPPFTASSQINIFNLRASRINETQFISWDSRAAPRSELVMQDGKLLKKCFQLIEAAMADLVVPDAKAISVPISSEADQSHDPNILATCMLDIDHKNIGKLIGRNGRTIRQIQDAHEVSIVIGQWLEVKKENREEVNRLIAGKCDKSSDAVTISGAIRDIQSALAEVKSIMSHDPREPPSKKYKY